MLTAHPSGYPASLSRRHLVGEIATSRKREAPGSSGGTPRLGFFSPRQFANYANGVKVNYTGGYANVPSDLKLAALEMVKVLYKGREGTKTVRLQGDDSTSHDLSMDGFPPQIRRVLNLYRLPM